MKTILNGRHFRNLALLSLAVLLPITAQSQEAAELKVIARTGQAGLTTINNSVSINNAGLAAFSGITAAGRGSFVADANGPREVRPIDASTAVGNNLQLNDAGTLVARQGVFFFTQPPVYFNHPILGPILIEPGYSESSDYVRTWAADGGGGLNLIAKGVSRTDAQTLLTDKVGPFASVGTRVTINNAGQVAFVADQGTGLVNSYVLATAKGGNEFNTYPAFLGAAPMIADDGSIVVRPGSTDGNPILLFNYDLTSSETIASSGSGFTAMGRMPGISDDGQLVAFYGVLSPAGAAAFGTTEGPGIFLSYPSSGARRTIRLAGLTNADSSVFNSFDGNQRVGVNRQTADGKVLVAFFGTNGTGVKGIWAVKYDFTKPTDILLVKIILQSDLVDGIGPWDDFRLSDPVNTLGQVACWAQSGTRQAIVTATPPAVTLHRVTQKALIFTAADGIDDPLKLTTNRDDLSKQPALGLGLVADGVTPMLIKLAPPVTTTATYAVNFAVQGGTVDLASHLRILKSGQFVEGNELVLSPADPVGYAYLSGINAEDVFFSSAPELLVTVTATTPGGSGFATAFRIRKPPVVLVHGYNAKADTWSEAFKTALATSDNVIFRPENFIIPIEYGVSSGGDPTVNTFGNLYYLTQLLDAVLQEKIENTETGLKSSWAFTRYDVVGHSQGGVLLRMLCTKEKVFWSQTQFAGPENYYRGRFRRIITIGSPHNGSLVLYYILKLKESSNILYKRIPARIGERLLRDKFDPFSDQIRMINDQKYLIDNRAKFRLYKSKIASGLGGCPPVYALTGLCELAPGFIPAIQRRDILLPAGSDGVVDYQSQGAGADSTTGMFVDDLSHSPPTDVFFGPFLGAGKTETSDAGAGFEVAAALEGDRAFGPFHLPIRLSANDRLAVDTIVPGIAEIDAVGAVFFAPGFPQKTAAAANGVTLFRFRMVPPAAEPIQGDVNWFVESFGPDGVSNSGVSWQADPSDSRNVTVTVAESVVGDVVLYSGYGSSTGKLVLSKPIIVVSRPAGAVLNGIELVPSSATMSIGDKLAPEIWGVYDNGVRSRLFISDDRPASFSSSDQSIVGVEVDGTISAKTVGSGIVSASYNGFSAQVAVSTVPAPELPNTAPVANDKTQHAPLVGVVTTVYSAATDTSDEDGDGRTLSITVPPTHGTATTDGATVIYTGNGFVGSDAITVEANDGSGGTDSATITLTNTAPVAVSDTGKVLGQAVTTIGVAANDTDADNDALRVNVVTQGTHGTVTIAQDGKSITYSLGPTFINGDEFSYTVTDDRGGFMQANVTVTLGDVAVFVLAGKGMQIPGEPPGTVFATFGAPSINPIGMTAFAATYRTPTARTKHGIFTGLPAQAFAREGDPAPGTPLTFGTFSDPVMNRIGAVAFKAKLVRASAATAEGLWLTDSGAPALVVRQADAAAGVAGAFFRRLLDVALPDNGELLFTASLMTGRGGVTAANDFGLWRRKADGQLQLVLRKGDQIADGTISRRVKTLAIFGALSGTTGQRRGFDNRSDTLLRISFTDGVSALVLMPAGGSPEMLLRTGQPVAALGGAMIRGFSLPVLSDDGGVTVLAALTIARGGPVADNDTVILHRRADGTIRLVAREGVALVDPPGAVPRRFGDPVSGNQDGLAFAGILKIPSGGVRIGTDVGLWRSDASGALKSLVREGAVAPETGGGTFASFQSLAWAGSRGLAFTAKLNLRAGVVIAANDTGLWAENADGQLSLLLRKNDRISIGGATKRIQTLTVLSAVLGSPSQGHSFNSDGGFAVRATFTDGSQSILTVWVP